MSAAVSAPGWSQPPGKRWWPRIPIPRHPGPGPRLLNIEHLPVNLVQCGTKFRCRSFKLRVERRMGDWMSGSEKVAAYRLHAAHCAEIARRSWDPETRVSLIKMSEVWLRLADLAEKNSESQQPVGKRQGVRNPVQVIAPTRQPPPKSTQHGLVELTRRLEAELRGLPPLRSRSSPPRETSRDPRRRRAR